MGRELHTCPNCDGEPEAMHTDVLADSVEKVVACMDCGLQYTITFTVSHSELDLYAYDCDHCGRQHLEQHPWPDEATCPNTGEVTELPEVSL